MKSFIVFAFGFGTGWAVRSLADSPHGVGVKLAEVAHRAKKQVNRWAATERERIVDIIAEGRFRAEQGSVFSKAKKERDQKIA
jgi:hypothetical protein